ncbi:MAG: LysO family transporter [Bacteroidota bacterium]|nr:LysO family transporter [Bacteroidota bacterium]
MIAVLILMILGIGIGALIGKYKTIIRINEKLTTWTIYLLLFLLGISVGLNEKVIIHLSTIGLQALLITFGAVGGSLFVSWIVFHYIFKGPNIERRKEYEE